MSLTRPTLSGHEVSLPANDWYPMPHQMKTWKAMRSGKYHTFVLPWHRRCIAQGTPILMNNGSWKYIEEVQVGDVIRVWADGAYQEDTITAVMDNGVRECVSVEAVGKDVIYATPDHPFMTYDPNNGGYKFLPLQEAVGYQAVTYAPQNTSGISQGKLIYSTLPNKKCRVYDLTTEKHHRFFAGSFLVHNCGKDEIALHDTAIRTQQRVGNYWHMLPQQEQARRAIWDAVNPRTGRIRWQDAFPPELIKHVDNQSMKLTFHNGSTWQVLGSDNYNSLVGSTPVHIVMSEAALADKNAYGFFRPILAENHGTSVHISSTRGRNHFYEMFKTAETDDDSYCEWLSAADTGIFTPEQLKRELKIYIDLYGAAIGKSLFLQEYMSDWDAATIGAVWAAELKQVREEDRAAPCKYDSRFPVMTFWDIGVSDLTVILFAQEVGNEVRLIDWYSSNDIGLDHYAEIVNNKPYIYLGHFAPHDIAVREWSSGLSRIDEAKRFGIKFKRVEKIAKGEQIAAASHLLRRMVFNVISKKDKDPMDDCEYVLNALGEYKFKFDRERRVMAKNPEHNWASHYADALQVMAVALQQTGSSKDRQRMMGKTIETSLRVKDIIAMQSRQTRRRGAWG